MNYFEDSEDIDFPPVKFSKDLVYKDPNKKRENCFQKFIKIFKNKRNLILLISGLTVVIVAIILIAVLTRKKKDKKEGVEDNQNIIEGGYMVLELKQNENLALFNNEKIIKNGENWEFEHKNSRLRNLIIDSSYVNNIIEIEDEITTGKDALKFNVTFKKVLDTMDNMFKNNQNLLSIDLSSLVSKNINSLNSAFLGCNNLQYINFNNFNSENVENMDSAFENCSSLKSLDLSTFNTPKLTSMAKAFKNCDNLKNLQLDNFKLNASINISEAFDSIIVNVVIIINNRSLDIIKNETNVTKIYTEKNCTKNIENCGQCNSEHPHKCEKCKNGFSEKAENGNIIRCDKNTITSTIIDPKTTIIFTTAIAPKLILSTNPIQIPITNPPENISTNILSTIPIDIPITNLSENISTNISSTYLMEAPIPNSTNILINISSTNLIAPITNMENDSTNISSTNFIEPPIPNSTDIFINISSTIPESIPKANQTINQTRI